MFSVHMFFLVCLFVLFGLLAPLPGKADCPDPVQSEWGKNKKKQTINQCLVLKHNAPSRSGRPRLN